MRGMEGLRSLVTKALLVFEIQSFYFIQGATEVIFCYSLTVLFRFRRVRNYFGHNWVVSDGQSDPWKAWEAPRHERQLQTRRNPARCTYTNSYKSKNLIVDPVVIFSTSTTANRHNRISPRIGSNFCVSWPRISKISPIRGILLGNHQ